MFLSSTRAPTGSISHFLAIGALIAVALLLAGCEDPEPEAAVEAAGPTLDSGSGSWVFTETSLASERPLTVWYHLPDDLAADAPVVMVIHGMGRNGESYRDAWVDAAEERGFFLVVPEFTSDLYPGSREYNLGNVFASDGDRNPESEWSFGLIEPVFEDARRRAANNSSQYRIYGHSAGSQFVHRFLLFEPDARAERVVLANAGWYTLPTLEEEWPYGLAQGSEPDGVVPEAAVRGFLERDVTVLLADQDTVTTSSSLRNTEEARAQGPHRFARGHHYFDVVEALADEIGIPFEWQLDTVPGVGHSNRGMAPAAAAILVP